MAKCVSCGESIPSVISRCPLCNHDTGLVSYPRDPEWWDDVRVQSVVDEAESESVTFDRLTTRKTGFLSRLFSGNQFEKRRSYDRPLVGYLSPGETPHFILMANKYIIIRDRAESRYLRDESSICALMAEEGFRPLVLVTDQRVLVVLGDSEGDILASASIHQIVDIEADLSHPAHYEWNVEQLGGVTSDVDAVYKLKLTTVTSKFEIYLHPSTKRSTVNSVVKFLEDLAVTSDQFDSLPEDSNNRSKSSKDTEQTGQIISASVLQDIRSSRERVDWGEAIQTGLRTGTQALQYAAMTSYSTPVIVGLSTLAGTTLKAHHGISGNSKSIDPDELLDRGIAGVNLGDRFDLKTFSPKRIGASIGISRYLAERVSPESYQHFVERTNADTILKGAKSGEKLSQRPEVPLTPKQGAIAGACAGLVYSYVPADSPLREVDPEGHLSFDDDSTLSELLG